MHCEDALWCTVHTHMYSTCPQQSALQDYYTTYIIFTFVQGLALSVVLAKVWFAKPEHLDIKNVASFYEV